MTMQNNMIAAGWDNYSLTNIESIAVDGVYFSVPIDIGLWQEGQPYIQGNSIVNFTAYSAAQWVMTEISMAQYYYIFNTILGNKYSGKVTIRTRQFETEQYVICNAILTIPQRESGLTANRVGRGWYDDFLWEFSRVEIIEEELMHGIIYATGASTAQAAVTTTPVLLTAFAADGVSDNMTVANATDSITALFAGDYEITCNLQFISDGSTAWRFHIRIDAVEQVYSAQVTSNATPDEMSVSFGGILALSANEVITVYVESDAGGGASITVSDCQLMAKRLALNV